MKNNNSTLDLQATIEMAYLELSGRLLIAVYNYKGGVGKTTIAVNLVATLARQGRRTLLVDCDPQSNATSFYLGSTQAEDGHGDDEAPLPFPTRPLGLLYSDSQESSEEEIAAEQFGEEDYEFEEEEDQEEVMVHSPLSQPTVKLKSDSLHRPTADPCACCKAVNLADIRRRYEPTVYHHLRLAMRGAITPDTNLAVKSVRGFDNLWILPEDPQLVRLEANFMDALNFHGDFFIHGLAGFRHMVDHIAKNPELEIEYVIVDLGPSAGAINQVIILNCDYILPPLLADYFSVCSMDGLLNTLLPYWLGFLQQYRDETRKRPLDTEDRTAYSKFGAPPKILPFLLNGYPMRNRIMVKNYAIWSQTMSDFLEGPESTVSPRVKELMIRDGEGKVFVNFCKDLVSVMRISHTLRKPIVIMGSSDVRKTILFADMKVQTCHAKERYNLLAKFIQQLT